MRCCIGYNTISVSEGFIRKYYKFLGINGDELLAQFASERGLSVPQQNAEPVKAEDKHEVNKTESIGMKVKPGMGSTKESSKAFSSGDDFKSMNESSFNAKNIIMGLAGVVVVFLASIFMILIQLSHLIASTNLIYCFYFQRVAWLVS